eukprot:893240-Alexandrium_andersonii.AAC.1
MSASLVGSEMCIRDSPPAPQFSMNRSARASKCRPVPSVQQQAYNLSLIHIWTLPTICSV